MEQEGFQLRQVPRHILSACLACSVPPSKLWQPFFLISPFLLLPLPLSPCSTMLTARTYTLLPLSSPPYASLNSSSSSVFSQYDADSQDLRRQIAAVRSDRARQMLQLHHWRQVGEGEGEGGKEEESMEREE
jgi:hypothetical protein